MSTPNPIRVMIVDDHDVIRRGLTALLRTFADLELVGEARNGKQAVQVCQQIRPDVILMDLVMPEMDGLAATRMIRQRHSQLQVIALTSFREKELVQDALQAGAISYLLKDVSANDLAEAIRAAYAGQPTLIPEAASVLVQMTGQRLPSDYELSLREQEVLALMVKGLNNREIAGRLVVSPSTARAHVSHILAKLGVSNRAEAIALALRQRWSLD